MSNRFKKCKNVGVGKPNCSGAGEKCCSLNAIAILIKFLVDTTGHGKYAG